MLHFIENLTPGARPFSRPKRSKETSHKSLSVVLRTSLVALLQPFDCNASSTDFCVCFYPIVFGQIVPQGRTDCSKPTLPLSAGSPTLKAGGNVDLILCSCNIQHTTFAGYCSIDPFPGSCLFKEPQTDRCDYTMRLKRDQQHLQRSCYSKAVEQHR